MDGLRAGVAAGLHDFVDQQIGLRRGRRAQMHRLVGHLDMERVLVGVGIDGDRLDAHLAGRLDDAAGDFTAIGNQDFLEHGRPLGTIITIGSVLGGEAGEVKERCHPS